MLKKKLEYSTKDNVMIGVLNTVLNHMEKDTLVRVTLK